MHRIRYRRILATFGGAAALSFLLAACSSNATESHTPKPHVTHSAEATPTPTANNGEIFQTEPIAEAPAIVQQLEAMPMETDADIAAFNAIPKADQLTWLSWATNNSIAEDFAAPYYQQSLKPSDVYPATVSINNTPAEALTIGYYNRRVPKSMPTASDALKALIASLPDGINDGGYTYELSKIKPSLSNWTVAKPASLGDGSPETTITNNPILQTNSEGLQFYDITSTYTGTDDLGIAGSGNEANDVVYVPYTDFKGVKTGTWLAS